MDRALTIGPVAQQRLLHEIGYLDHTARSERMFRVESGANLRPVFAVGFDWPSGRSRDLFSCRGLSPRE
jgi:hypothetical protein